MINDNFFETKDLMIGTLGVVDYKSDKDVLWSKKKAMPYTLFYKAKSKNIANAYIAKEIFGNNSYYFFNENENRNDVLKASNGKYAILNNIPISIFTDKKYIFSCDLKIIKYRLNIQDAYLKIKDDILQKLKEYFEKIEEIKDYNLKEFYVNKLGYLTEKYINLVLFPKKEHEDEYQDTSLEILEVGEEVKKEIKRIKKKTKKR